MNIKNYLKNVNVILPRHSVAGFDQIKIFLSFKRGWASYDATSIYRRFGKDRVIRDCAHKLNVWRTYPAISWTRVCKTVFSKSSLGIRLHSNCVALAAIIPFPVELADTSWVCAWSSRLVRVCKGRNVMVTSERCNRYFFTKYSSPPPFLKI